MLENPSHWQKHYAGTPKQQMYSRFYSFSDRIRYYWPVPGVHSAFEHLMANLADQPLPLSLVSQYLPRQYEQIRSGRLKNHPALFCWDGWRMFWTIINLPPGTTCNKGDRACLICAG